MFIFPDIENTGNLFKGINKILQEEFTSSTGNRWNTRVVTGCCYNFLAFVANFELRDILMEWDYCTRLHCICDCSLEGNIGRKSLCGW